MPIRVRLQSLFLSLVLSVALSPTASAQTDPGVAAPTTTIDRLGVAVVSNGLSTPHRDYLALGGLGFLLGDGTLRYGRENILETYYTAHLWRGLSASGGLQYIDHPGYNRDRGPVLVGMLRLHADF